MFTKYPRSLSKFFDNTVAILKARFIPARENLLQTKVNARRLGNQLYRRVFRICLFEVEQAFDI